MLTTATVLMSLGTDPMNTRHVLSNRTDTADISFAKSFDENSALAGEMKQTGDGRKQKDTAETECVISVKNQDVPAALSRLKVKGNVSAGDGMQNESDGIKNQILPVSAKGAASISSGETMTTHSEGLKEDTSMSVQAKMPDDQLPVGDEKDVCQNSVTGEIDRAKTDATDGVTASHTDVAVSAMPPISDNRERPGIQNQKEIPVTEKDQEAVSTKTIAKGYDGIAKTAKTGKTEDKLRKTFVTRGNAVDVEAQTVVTVPAMVLPMAGQSNKLNAAPDAALLSGPSAAAGRSVGMTAITASKVDKQSVSTAKADGDRAKTVVSTLVDDPAFKKMEIVGTKTASSDAKATDENAKVQNPVAAITATGLTHIEPGMPGVAIGGIPGGATAHVITATSQMTGTNDHAAIPQAESGAIDTAGPTDAIHKTLMATPTTLEVGVANGTHGWLKIRAEMTGDGAVNASLSTASSSGQEMLHRELPSLTAYLQSERVTVNTVVIQTAVAAGADSQGFAGEMNNDGRGQAPQSGGQGGENRQDTVSTVVNRTEKEVPYNDLSGVGDGLLSSASYAGGGSWLSVRA